MAAVHEARERLLNNRQPQYALALLNTAVAQFEHLAALSPVEGLGSSLAAKDDAAASPRRPVVDAVCRAVDLANETVPPGNVYTAAWEKSHGFSNRFVADLAKAVFDIDEALSEATADTGDKGSSVASASREGSTEPATASRVALLAAAKRLYLHYTGNHPTVHCNRFLPWDDLSLAEQAEWIGRAALAQQSDHQSTGAERRAEPIFAASHSLNPNGETK